MCPDPSPLQAGEKAQLLEAECLGLKQREELGEERALALWSSVEAGPLPGAASTAAAGAVSALLLQVLNYSGSTGACKRGDRYDRAQVQLVALMDPVGGMCPQYRASNCSLLCALISLWGCHIQFGTLGVMVLEAVAC